MDKPTQFRTLDGLIDELNDTVAVNIDDGKYKLSRKQAKDLIMEFVDRYNTGKSA